MYQSLKPHPAAAFGPNGLASLRYRSWQLLAYGDLRVSHVVMRDAAGQTVPASADSTLESDAAAGRVLRKFAWGEVEARYTPKAGRLNIALTVRNRSPHTIQRGLLRAVRAALSREDRGIRWGGPLVGHNVGDPTIISSSSRTTACDCSPAPGATSSSRSLATRPAAPSTISSWR